MDATRAAEEHADDGSAEAHADNCGKPHGDLPSHKNNGAFDANEELHAVSAPDVNGADESIGCDDDALEDADSKQQNDGWPSSPTLLSLLKKDGVQEQHRWHAVSCCTMRTLCSGQT